MESQVSSDVAGSAQPEDVFIKDVITSETSHVASTQPAKKQTRKWAAWTRQEEESFFNALRQVGKNFEKITARVQSKNKDQVRHYYYRLVRRMNKLLGSQLSLDAKNAKETNAAMLRWWSLLQKHSIKASKLHLKPRRFKVFLETLEHQILKDRKKNPRKRPFQGENCSTPPSHALSNQDGASGHDVRIDLVHFDGQNIQNLGPAKGSSLRRNASTSLDRNNCKGDSAPAKPPRPRRRAGSTSTAAYKRWEKAAIAGVSLVADAAAHLERSALDKLADSAEDIQGGKDVDPVSKDTPPVSSFQQNMFFENSARPLMKLKLQLFPLDESTRRALELDNHNPHLELTLSSRKRITSILEHMNRKWGSSSIASGELILFPYNTRSLDLMGCQKWTHESALTAADVYAAIGSPPVFRLRYAWFANADCRSIPLQEPLATNVAKHINMDCVEIHNVDQTECPQVHEHNTVPLAPPTIPAPHELGKSLDADDKLVSAGNVNTPTASSFDFPDKLIECHDVGINKNFLEPSGDMSHGAFSKQLEYVDKESHKRADLTTLEWADSLTNISISELLTEVPHTTDANGIGSPLLPGSQSLEQIPFSCDSFDAAIAAHVNKHLGKSPLQPTFVSSIWDAEETCDAFSFPKNNVHSDKVQNSKDDDKQYAAMSLVPSGSPIEKPPETEDPMDHYPAEVHVTDECQPDGNLDDGLPKDLRALTDIYWPDSLGPLDLGAPCRYYSEDFMLSDSLGGLNRLLTSSLDAFQNCSFFGSEHKETPSTTVGACETASFSDYKINSEV